MSSSTTKTVAKLLMKFFKLSIGSSLVILELE